MPKLSAFYCPELGSIKYPETELALNIIVYAGSS
jgi:hypothetical protein